jgi:murein DD-endopeptidase MepM/ murein hydrolase activator NlpD
MTSSGLYRPYYSYTISSGFGPRNLSVGAGPLHFGIDIKVPYGTPVYAATDRAIYYTGGGCKLRKRCCRCDYRLPITDYCLL